MPLTAVLLDLDGTLAESLPALGSAYRRFLAGRGRAGSPEEFAGLDGPTIPEIVETLARRHGLEEERGALIREYLGEVTRAYAAEARPAEGAAELLRTLDRLGLRAAVVSSCPAPIAEGFLEAHGLGRFVETLVDAEGLEAGKPDPAIYRRALERLEVAPQEALAVEDSPAGVLSASGSGLRTLALGGAGRGIAEVRGIGPVEPVAGLRAAARRVEEIAGRARCRLRPLRPGFRIVVRSEPTAPLPAAVEVRIEEIWREERAARGEDLRDGTILSYWSFRDEALVCRRESYRRFLAALRDPSLLDPLDLRPVGVVGVLRAAEAVVFGVRSAAVTQYPGRLELVPSGGFGEAAPREDGTLDPAGQLLRELEEETGLPPSLVSAVRPFALALDLDDRVFDVGCEIALAADRRETEARLRPTPEYSGFVVVPIGELDRFLARERERIVPVSSALLRALGLAPAPA